MLQLFVSIQHARDLALPLSHSHGTMVDTGRVPEGATIVLPRSLSRSHVQLVSCPWPA
jgi:hypothetical protein